MKAHPIAEIFPMMPDNALRSLSENIKKNGLLEPILLYEGMILDGRNRFAACEMAGVTPETVEFDDPSINPVEFVWSKNAERRQLDVSQLVALRNESVKQSISWMEARQKEIYAANEARKEKGKAIAQGKKQPSGAQNCAPLFSFPEPIPSSKEHRNSLEARRLAAITGAGATTTHQVLMAEKERPDLYQKIKEGNMSASKADEIRRADKKTVPGSEPSIVSDPFIGKMILIKMASGSIGKINMDVSKYKDKEVEPLTRDERCALMSKLRAMKATW
jgi:ParB-like chromosome segregation protein Spo0J